jgi:hypothetical protein
MCDAKVIVEMWNRYAVKHFKSSLDCARLRLNPIVQRAVCELLCIIVFNYTILRMTTGQREAAPGPELDVARGSESLTVKFRL